MGSNKGEFKGKPSGEFPSFGNDHLMVQKGIGKMNLEESEEGDWLVISRGCDRNIRTENYYMGSPNSAPKSWGQPSMLARPYKSDHVTRTNWHSPDAGFVSKPVGHRVMPPSSSSVNSSDNLKGLNYGGKSQPFGGSFDGMKVMNGGGESHPDDDFDEDYEDEDDFSSEEDEFNDEFDEEAANEIDDEFGHRFNDNGKVSRQAGRNTTHKEWVPGKELAHNSSDHYLVPPKPGVYGNYDSRNVSHPQIGHYKPKPAIGGMIPQPFSFMNRRVQPFYPPPLGNQFGCSSGGMQGRNDGVKRQISLSDVGDTGDVDDDYSDDYVEALKSAHMGRSSAVKKQGPPNSTSKPWGQVGAYPVLNIPPNIPPTPWSGAPSQRPENRAVFQPVPFADKNVTARPLMPPPNGKQGRYSAAGVGSSQMQAMGYMSKKDSTSNANPTNAWVDGRAFALGFAGEVSEKLPTTDGNNASKQRILQNMSTRPLGQRDKPQVPGIGGNFPMPSVLKAQNAKFRGPTGGPLMPQTALCAKTGMMPQSLTPLPAKDKWNSPSVAASSTMKAKNGGRKYEILSEVDPSDFDSDEEFDSDGREFLRAVKIAHKMKAKNGGHKDEILSEVDPSDFDSDEEFDSDGREFLRAAKISHKMKSRGSEKTLESNGDMKQKNKSPENQQEEENHCCQHQMEGSSDATNGCVHEKPLIKMKEAEKSKAPAPLSEGCEYRTKEVAKCMKLQVAQAQEIDIYAPEMLKMMNVLEKTRATKIRHREEIQKLEKEWMMLCENY